MRKIVFNILFVFSIFLVFTSKGQEIYLPFLDDFSSYTGMPKAELWEGNNCFVNQGYQYLPPSIGVVTLDAIDKDGSLYPDASSFGFMGDTLCSKTIRLDSLQSPIVRALSVSDSIYLSFFVQPGGGAGDMWERIGSQPSSKDSLVLQFFSATENSWNTVWSMKGMSVDYLFAMDSLYFRYVLIPIKEDKYFNAFFKFRFLTYSSLDANPDANYVMNCDQWNIDYVYINYNRSCSDSSFRDIAFVNPATSLLKNYTAVPYKQYRPDMMKANLATKIINLYSSALSSSYKYSITDKNNIELASYDGGFENILPFMTSHEFQTSPNHTTPPLQYAFPLMTQEEEYTITHVVREGVGQDDLSTNDTIKFKQVFSNYFAYDDGTSEGGFGINPLKGSNLALGFNLTQSDTLSAIDIYFNQTNNQDTNDKKYFFLCVWDATNGENQVPNNLVYKSERLLPISDSLNKFTRYSLTEPLVLQPGTFFISLEIKNRGDYVNIGFDRNNNASSHTYSKISSGEEWKQSFIVGALMIRPYFGYKAVGFENILTESELVIYPNPTKGIVHVKVGEKKVEECYLTSVLGAREKIYPVQQSESNYIYDLSKYKDGVYILNVITSNSKIYSTKIIKQN